MDIASTDSAGFDLQQNFIGCRFRRWKIDHLKPTVLR
jgi:hypothetical protein